MAVGGGMYSRSCELAHEVDATLWLKKCGDQVLRRIHKNAGLVSAK